MRRTHVGIQREQFDFSRAMPTLNLRTGMLGERDCISFKLLSVENETY
jgi:hypothetical protein